MEPLKCALCLILSVGLPSAFAGNEFNQLTKDLPKDAVALVERMVACNYWRGEMPKDEAVSEEVRASGRIEMIEVELKKAKCSTFDADLKKAKSKYGKNRTVSAAFEKAKTLTPAD